MRLNSNGFTLIEVIITLVIIGLLAVLVVPIYADYIARTQLTEAIILTGDLKKQVVNSLQSDRCRSINESEYKQVGKYGIAEIITDAPSSNSNQISASGKTGCSIKYTMNSQNTASILVNKYIILDVLKNGSLKYTNGSIEQKYIPKAFMM